jgi:predicted acylesterase/phospholipase RssA
VISVAIQGGAMRSIYCFGAVRALIEGGYASQVRMIHTASAGCVAGVILAGATGADGRGVTDMRDEFLDQLDGTQFISLRRIRRIVDVDRLVNAMRSVAGVSTELLARRDLGFEVGMTDARTGAPKYVELAECPSNVELDQALRATMAIPLLYPKRIKIDGRRYIDGGISDPLPALRALQHNPTVLVAISSVAKSHLGWELEGLEPAFIRFTPGILSAQVKHLLLARNPLAAATEAFTELESMNGVRIIRIAPDDQSLVGHRLQTDKQKLLRLEELGYRDGVRALAGLKEPMVRQPG